MHFGSTLKLLRVDSGLSLRALARRVGVSSAYLSRVENGHDPVPTAGRLSAIADAMDLPPEMLVQLAQQTASALVDYVDRVPAASALFLEIARRGLDTAQLERLREVMDDEFPEHDPDARHLMSALVGRKRVALGLECDAIEDVIEAGTALCVGRDDGGAAAEIARSIRDREAKAPTVIGNGVAVPHAVVEGASTAAALITLATPLDVPTPDGAPVELAIVLISSAGGSEHLEVLARIARLASHHIARELRGVTSPARALAIVKRLESLR